VKWTSIILSIILYACQTQAGKPITAAQVEREINRVGATQAIRNLSSSPLDKSWQQIEAHISNGEKEWVNIAKSLSTGADAGYAASLLISLAKALPKNPQNVLPLIDAQPYLSVSQLCGAPFIEPEESFYQQYLKDTKEALENLKNPQLEQQRQLCLKKISALLKTNSLAEKKLKG
jgi:hypothetical protein